MPGLVRRSRDRLLLRPFRPCGATSTPSARAQLGPLGRPWLSVSSGSSSVLRRSSQRAIPDRALLRSPSSHLDHSDSSCGQLAGWPAAGPAAGLLGAGWLLAGLAGSGCWSGWLAVAGWVWLGAEGRGRWPLRRSQREPAGHVKTGTPLRLRSVKNHGSGHLWDPQNGFSGTLRSMLKTLKIHA